MVSMAGLNQGEAVKRFRLRMGLTQKALAALVGLTRDQLANIETGRSNIPSKAESELSKMGFRPADPGSPEEDRPFRVRGSRRQIDMLISILEDCNQPESIRATAAIELRFALDLGLDGS